MRFSFRLSQLSRMQYCIEAAAAAGDAAGMGATALRALCGDDAELRRRAIAAGAKPVVFAEA